MPDIPNMGDINDARIVLAPLIDTTELIHTRTISNDTNATVWLKPENLQKTGSFKIRGASYKIAKLSQAQLSKGVVTASLGNHAQGVAYAAATHEPPIACTIVMPLNAPQSKIDAARREGATVKLVGESYADALKQAQDLEKSTGATFIHAFDDPHIIAGQGTIGAEIMEAKKGAVDVIVVPVGGGGLISGIAIAAKAMSPNVRIIGVQAANANAAQLSLSENEIVEIDHPHTVADGISNSRPGKLNFEIMKRLGVSIVTVTDSEIVGTVSWLLDKAKLLVEGAGAAGVAALRHHAQELNIAGRRVVVVLSGGNVDVTSLDRFITAGLADDGRILSGLNVLLSDQPGSLRDVLAIVAERKANVLEVVHQRMGRNLNPLQPRVTLTLAVRNTQQGTELVRALNAGGYTAWIDQWASGAHLP